MIFDESNHIERITIESDENEDELPDLWKHNEFSVQFTPSYVPISRIEWTENGLPFPRSPISTTEEPNIITSTSKQLRTNKTIQEAEEKEIREKQQDTEKGKEQGEIEKDKEAKEGPKDGYKLVPESALKDFITGPWIDPENIQYGRGKRHQALFALVKSLAIGTADLESLESAFVVLAEDEPANYKDAMNSPNADKWREACRQEYDLLMGYGTWDLITAPKDTNVVGSHWTFRVKHDNLGEINRFKSRLIAQGFSQVPGVDFNETYSPTIRLTSIHFILAFACENNLEL